MKKLVAVLLVLISVFSVIFAATTDELLPTRDNSFAAILDNSYLHSARSLGMGSAGIAVGGRSDSFYMNPALLARRTLISIPYAQVTLYHPYDLLQKDEETGTSIVDDFMDVIESGNMQDITGPALGLLESIKAGRGKIAELDAGVTLGGGGFALGFHVNDIIHTYGNGVGGLDASLFDELNVNILAALGLRFDLTPSISLDIGVSSGVSVMGYTGLIGAQSVLDMMGNSGDGDPMTILKSTPLALGWSIPLNVGVNLNLPLGFSVGVVGRNLLNPVLGYNMRVMDVGEIMENPMGSVSAAFSGGERFTIKMDPSLDFGLGWKWNSWFLSPTLAVDVVDTIGLFKDDFSLRSFVDHLRIGAEVRLLSFLDLRGGINQGYWTVGAGIDLWAIKIDAAYYWQEFGDTAGDYGLDAFTIRINIGFDR